MATNYLTLHWSKHLKRMSGVLSILLLALFVASCGMDDEETIPTVIQAPDSEVSDDIVGTWDLRESWLTRDKSLGVVVIFHSNGTMKVYNNASDKSKFILPTGKYEYSYDGNWLTVSDRTYYFFIIGRIMQIAESGPIESYYGPIYTLYKMNNKQ